MLAKSSWVAAIISFYLAQMDAFETKIFSSQTLQRWLKHFWRNSANKFQRRKIRWDLVFVSCEGVQTVWSEVSSPPRSNPNLLKIESKGKFFTKFSRIFLKKTALKKKYFRLNTKKQSSSLQLGMKRLLWAAESNNVAFCTLTLRAKAQGPRTTFSSVCDSFTRPTSRFKAIVNFSTNFRFFFTF